MLLSSVFPLLFLGVPATELLLYIRFISTPKPDQLLMQSSTVLVNDMDRKGVITKIAWNVPDLKTAGLELNKANVRANEIRFFFPRFIGNPSRKKPNVLCSQPSQKGRTSALLPF